MKTAVNYLSTTKLAKSLGLTGNNLFQDLEQAGYIERVDKLWTLTEKGKATGATTKTASSSGKPYIVWDEEKISKILAGLYTENVAIEEVEEEEVNVVYLSALDIGKNFAVLPEKITHIFAELGWIEKKDKGWIPTVVGAELGAKQFEYPQSKLSYVCWKESIVENETLKENIALVKENISAGQKESKKVEQKEDVIEVKKESVKSEYKNNDFRTKFPPEHRAQDGHYVRSRAEVLIDNLLYNYNIVHAYERKLPIVEDVYCDFYLPLSRVYIEYWGIEEDERYEKRREEKRGIYQKYGFNLIEITNEDVKNLDDILPKKLLGFNVTTY